VDPLTTVGDGQKGRYVTSTNNRTRRLIAAGAFAVAAVAAPFAASALAGSGASEDLAGPACLAWFGNKEDGKCLSYSNGDGVTVGTPEFGLWGNDGAGISTGPMFPGRIYDSGVG
jgi:hypothetical protein